MEGRIKLKDLKIRWFIVIVLISIIPTVAIIFGAAFYSVFTEKDIDKVGTWVTLILQVLWLGIVWWKLVPRRCNIIQAIKKLKNDISLKEIFGIVFTQIGLSMGVSSILLAVLIFTNINVANSAINEQIMPVYHITDYIISMILGVLIAPVFEELVFRGIFFRRIGKRFGVWAGIIISSIIFAIGHVTLGTIGAFIFGITSCILYMKHKNILVLMAVHFVNNALAFGFEILGGIDIEEMNEVITLTQRDGIDELVFGLIVLSISMIFFIRFIKKNKQYIRRDAEIA